MENAELIRETHTIAPPPIAANGKILILDDDSFIRQMLGRLLLTKGRPYEVASDAAEARALLADQAVALILCDIHMPGESGLEFIRFVREAYPDTAVIMISGMDDPKLAQETIDIGAYGYLVKPFRPPEVMITISNALHRRKLEIENRAHLEILEARVSRRTESLQNALDDLHETMTGTVHAMATVVETRDPYTAGHQQRVSELAEAIAGEMGLSARLIAGLKLGGVIHDLGKISVPAEILTKPTRLTQTEFELIKTHPQAGYDILKDIRFPWPIAQMVIQHHEKMDGSGYPNGLAGDDILLESRILVVADVVEAMASHRPYRPALGIDLALDEISKNRGILYDDAVAAACLALFKQKGFALINA